MRRPWNLKTRVNRTTIKTTGLTSLLLLITQAVQALPVPGSQITNIASGDYVDAQGNVQVINSNPVSLTIQKVYALTLQQNQQQIATLGAPVAFPHLLTNTGNSPDQYLLTLTQLSSAFSMTGLSVYASPDGQEIKTTGQTSDLQLER
jgi:trimeric autotransporter adhesin